MNKANKKAKRTAKLEGWLFASVDAEKRDEDVYLVHDGGRETHGPYTLAEACALWADPALKVGGVK